MVFDIVTFGSAVVDTFIDTEFNKKSQSFNYKAGSKILVNNMTTDIGGGATNTAVAFARFGFNTGCICKIGDDNNSNDVLEMLKKEKVKFLGKKSKGATGHSIILDSKDHQRTILTFKGPGNSIKLSEIPKIKAKWLYYSSMLNESLKTQEKLIKQLSKKGTKLAFNPSEYLIKNVNLRSMIKLSDILIMNKEEAEILCSKYKKKGSFLDGLISLGAKIAVVTDKNKMIYASDGIKKYSLKPNKIKVIERTGAGDAFAAGFVAGVMANRPIQKCLELGLKEGESVIQYFGAKNKLLKRKLKK
ncbi:carbohydrate kinase family protein [Candidatus Pacearchaeota archaeon]|nr:carbohydrate kinase family protein [Candidatus Pacearchaeota archaeon]